MWAPSWTGRVCARPTSRSATAGGIHAIPLAEFALTGALHFIKGIPQLVGLAGSAHHWERYSTHQLAGRRALVVGLGGIGRRVGVHLRRVSGWRCGAWAAGRR